MHWSCLAQEMPSKTLYWRKGRRKGNSDGKTRKKKQATSGDEGYRKAKWAALDCTLWRTCVGKSNGLVRQTIK